MTMPAPTSPTPPPGEPEEMPDLQGGGLVGRPANIQTVFTTRGTQKFTPAYADPNRALQFPESIVVLDRMIRTDDQVGAIMSAITLPILDARWTLTDKGVRPGVVDTVREGIGLPADDDGPRAQDPAHPSRVVFSQHLEEALEGVLGYGFYPFEMEWEITVPGQAGHPTDPALAGRPARVLTGLHARPPATIDRIMVNRRGDLTSLIQKPIPGDVLTKFTEDGQIGIEIPTDNLLYYILKRRGADWSGVSVLRNSYRPWRIKDDYTRWDAIAAERTSLGIPMVTYDPQVMKREDALALAQSVRSGAEAGIAIPIGARLEAFGLAANTLDLGPRIDRANQAMSRSTLAMVLDMGHDDGARSLGETYLKMLLRSLGWTATKMATLFTEGVIRRIVAENYGPTEPYPRLVCEAITAETLSPDNLSKLIAAKVLYADDVLDADTRRRFGLPEADPDTARGAEDPATADATEPDATAGNPFVPVEEEDPAGGGGDQGDGVKPNPFSPEGQRRAASLSGYADYLRTLVV